ncbi:TlpA family protein disulfide reductase [Pseudozobellia thermophila]|uniref:Thiol-disulfide isomerase or thioredoxin n=1 Tax=Pseudozobellia thermophila TaxID=192903 RepID=A0A1M6F0R7_9FLAO|nr:TlpA disulfide reductase family protein [Pseudozobellia thermophila]SHI91273.1 Thiol-disulfide isomerase or thioredoxin [Pseudozobellia thermophila]
MRKGKIRIGDVLLLVFVLLVIIPQTRKPIQVFLNGIKVQLFSPSVLDAEAQVTVTPFEYRVTDLNGADVSITVGNGKVSFIGYWATWCPPCIAEMPSIQSLYDDYGDSVDFVLLTHEDPEVVRNFLERKKFSLPVYFPKMQAPEELYEKSIPANFVIDKTGKIVVKETGATDWNAEKIRTILDGLIAS